MISIEFVHMKNVDEFSRLKKATGQENIAVELVLNMHQIYAEGEKGNKKKRIKVHLHMKISGRIQMTYNF